MSELATASTSSPLPYGDWTIDAKASTVGFRVRHFGFATVEGRFHSFEGDISGGGAGDLLELRATATVSRRDFGLDWSGLKEAGRLLVSDRVTIALDLRARPATVRERQPEPDDGQ